MYIKLVPRARNELIQAISNNNLIQVFHNLFYISYGSPVSILVDDYMGDDDILCSDINLEKYSSLLNIVDIISDKNRFKVVGKVEYPILCQSGFICDINGLLTAVISFTARVKRLMLDIVINSLYNERMNLISIIDYNDIPIYDVRYYSERYEGSSDSLYGVFNIVNIVKNESVPGYLDI